jgi:hypothetical protein
LRTNHRVDLVDFPNHLRPAFSRDGPELGMTKTIWRC